MKSEKEIINIEPIDIEFRAVAIGSSIFNLNEGIIMDPSTLIKVGQQEIRWLNAWRYTFYR